MKRVNGGALLPTQYSQIVAYPINKSSGGQPHGNRCRKEKLSMHMRRVQLCESLCSSGVEYQWWWYQLTRCCGWGGIVVLVRIWWRYNIPQRRTTPIFVSSQRLLLSFIFVNRGRAIPSRGTRSGLPLSPINQVWSIYNLIYGHPLFKDKHFQMPH